MADDDSSSDNPGSPGEAGFMVAVLVVMFVALFVGWKTPETVVRVLDDLIHSTVHRRNTYTCMCLFVMDG